MADLILFARAILKVACYTGLIFAPILVLAVEHRRAFRSLPKFARELQLRAFTFKKEIR